MFGNVYDAGHIFGGQYLYVVADLASLRGPVCDEQCYFKFPKDFLSSVTYFADRLKAKQGKYLPAIGLRVQQPEELIKNLGKFTNIFVMNSNYLNEIKQLTNNRFNYITGDHEVICR